MAKKAKLVKFLFGPDLCAHFAAPSIVWSGFFLSAQLGEQGKPDFGGHFMKIVANRNGNGGGPHGTNGRRIFPA